MFRCYVAAAVALLFCMVYLRVTWVDKPTNAETRSSTSQEVELLVSADNPVETIRVLHVSTPHPGVILEVQNLLHRLHRADSTRVFQLNWTCVSCHLDPWTDYSVITKEEADRIWEHSARALCMAHDVIIVSDTIPQARAFLQNGCPKQLILRATTRIDWQLWQDWEYRTLIAYSVATMPNVHLVPNNHFEMWYAHILRRMSGLQETAILPGLTLQPPYSAPVPNQSGQPCPELPLHDLFMVQSHHDGQLLGPLLTQAGVPVHALTHRNYCGSASLRDRVLVHVPYQASTMSMWENIGLGVVYFLPSMALMGRTFLPQRVCCLLPNEVAKFAPDYDAFLKWTDWYYEGYQDLFFYFHDIKDLHNVTTRRAIDIEAKRKRNYKWMEQRDAESLGVWSKLMQGRGVGWEKGESATQ